MGKKKTSKFHIEYGKSKNCSDCKYNSCKYYDTMWNRRIFLVNSED